MHNRAVFWVAFFVVIVSGLVTGLLATSLVVELGWSHLAVPLGIAVFALNIASALLLAHWTSSAETPSIRRCGTVFPTPMEDMLCTKPLGHEGRHDLL